MLLCLKDADAKKILTELWQNSNKAELVELIESSIPDSNIC